VTAAGPGPLAGVRVLELASVVMAPYAGQILGDLGAEVTKVETGSGDPSRVMGGGPHPELSGVALNLHRNKRSIGIDLKRPEGRAVVLRLLRDCDVFVTNLRPGPLARLGLAYDDLAADFPQLVHCEAMGFRSDTAESDLPAYDDIIQALTGFPQLLGIAFGETHFIPSTIVDKIAGLFIVQGVLAALVARSTTGRGQRVEIPMFDVGLAFNLVEHIGRAAVAGEPAGYNRVLSAHRGPHRTTDGYLAVMPYTDEHWRVLFRAVGQEAVLDEPLFADRRLRLANPDGVYGTLAGIIRERPTGEWVTLCHEHGIPASAVPPLDDILADPAHHRGVLSDADHPVVGRYRQIRQPVIFFGSEPVTHRPAPLRAQDSVAVLEGAGYERDEIDRLVAAGVVERREGGHQ
jgi:crotonobetainyl-CoA:carnitine CoA-transferase CaiB-like acyl-CoA transferase